MKDIKITVLVAVYNAEAYLRQCLDSLLGQTLREIQVICVDDASTDSSWQILQQYAQADDRIQLLRQPVNKGQAKARNLALQYAQGLYTCFLDSDDWLAPDALERIVACFSKDEEVDAVLFDCRYYYPENQSERPYGMPPFETLSGREAFRLSLDWQVHGIYAVKTSIHLRYPYDDSLHSYSDDNTTRLHFLACRKVRRSSAVYYYRQHAQSVTHQVSRHRFDYLEANWEMRKKMLALGADSEDLVLYENLRWLNIVALTLYAFRFRGNRGVASGGNSLFSSDNALSSSDNAFSGEDYAYGLSVVKRMWLTIDKSSLSARNHYKLGYLLFRQPFLPVNLGWRLFLVQERIYYFVRKMLGNLPA